MLKFNKDRLYDKIYACWIGKNIGGHHGAGPMKAPASSTILRDLSRRRRAPAQRRSGPAACMAARYGRGGNRQNRRQSAGRILDELCRPVLERIRRVQGKYGDRLCPRFRARCTTRSGSTPTAHGSAQRSGLPYSPAIRNAPYAMRLKTPAWTMASAKAVTQPIFVAAMESAAFVIDDIHTLIEIGLSKTRLTAALRSSVRIVLDGHKTGLDWKTVREQLVEDSADLGWFQAPGKRGVCHPWPALRRMRLQKVHDSRH